MRPAQHYTMGGVRTNHTGESPTLKGLFSAGEAACWDMHGFNRLGGNSVAETVVAGMIVGESAEPAVRRAIEAHLVAQPEIRRVLRLITLQWGEKSKSSAVRSIVSRAGSRPAPRSGWPPCRLRPGCIRFR